MALTQEDLQAIGALMDRKLTGALEPIMADIAAMKEDVEQIREDTAVMREAVNSLGEWTEIASDVLKIKYPVEK